VSSLSDLRLADLLTLLAAQETGTISGAARKLKVTPSQVSKAISRLERQFGVRLLSRGAHGVAATPEARRMLPRIAHAVGELRALTGARDAQDPDIELTVAGPSYLIANVVPVFAELAPRVRIRGLELPPAYLRAHVAENVFDVAIVPGGIPGHPATWTDDVVGEIRAVLLGRPSLVRKLAPLPLAHERVRALPFIVPAMIGGDRFIQLADACPLPREDRHVAHEVQSVGAALEIAARTDHVVFGPALAARRFIEGHLVAEIPVVGWDVREPLHVMCNGDRVLSRLRTALARAARMVVGEGGEGGDRSG
jgi:DNA-binding transcriptional LysR family regulator